MRRRSREKPPSSSSLPGEPGIMLVCGDTGARSGGCGTPRSLSPSQLAQRPLPCSGPPTHNCTESPNLLRTPSLSQGPPGLLRIPQRLLETPQPAPNSPNFLKTPSLLMTSSPSQLAQNPPNWSGHPQLALNPLICSGPPSSLGPPCSGPPTSHPHSPLGPPLTSRRLKVISRVPQKRSENSGYMSSTSSRSSRRILCRSQ